jgi:hypothetical protein
MLHKLKRIDMKKEHQRELIVAIIFFLMGGLFIMVPLNKTNQLNKIKSERAFKMVWKKYESKTKRLRVYTDIIYKNK